MRTGKILITNWHALVLKGEHVEGDASYRVVQKGEETPDAFTKDRLGELAARLPILVLNDEGHHCWRPNLAGTSEEALKDLTKEERDRLKEEQEEARIWLAGLDRINNCGLLGKDAAGGQSRGFSRAVDLRRRRSTWGTVGTRRVARFPGSSATSASSMPSNAASSRSLAFQSRTIRTIKTRQAGRIPKYFRLGATSPTISSKRDDRQTAETRRDL